MMYFLRGNCYHVMVVLRTAGVPLRAVAHEQREELSEFVNFIDDETMQQVEVGLS